ncbi:hypothetical protein ASC94_30435 [Massilia sp. Root418]|jgi:hypothetical protein|uniref:hypothetical protein n=1 Tax=Massilia sp. Root418 TaxID=1736532 RepID=UPI000700821B|nr:hypothetical protein [Massilia sp. Root418]KQX00200.1 hypothetical protein ASC94_30435 [Massilia sp. Root418]
MMANVDLFGMAFGFGAASAGVMLAGMVSAALYARKNRAADAALAVVAALSLAALLASPTQPATGAGEIAIASEPMTAAAAAAPVSSAPPGQARPAAPGGAAAAAAPPGDTLIRALLAVPQAGSIALTGPGLRAAQWDDLPARPLRWTAPQGELLRLEFPRMLPLGRSFTLSARHSGAQPGWRLQLLAENGQLLAEAAQPAGAAPLTLAWQPPLAEQLLLQARLLDAAGKLVAQGPVPLLVVPPVPLQIIGRFGAPSFDARALNQLLTDSNATLDWQTTLGKGLSRTETARADLAEPNAQVMDAAWFEALSAPARAALLAQTGQGVPLIILAGNAGDAALWQRELALRLAPQAPSTEKDDIRQFRIGGEQLTMPPASLNPAGQESGTWRAAAADSKGRPWLWQRTWKKGRISWVGVSDWHRYGISSPAALGQWWQALLDRAADGATQKMAWQQPDPMPVAGLRTEVCAQGAEAGAALHIDGLPATAWQARRARAESVCAAFLPRQPGWLTLRSGASEHRIYIHAAGDWPLWQQALRQDATALYAARTPEAPAAGGARSPLPSWPFAFVCAACMLLLWRRERR